MNFQTVKHFRQFVVREKNTLIEDSHTLSEITKLKNSIDGIIWTVRSLAASRKLAKMTDEERKMLLMWPEEKEFFLKYKIEHPENPWAYFKEYQQKIQSDDEKSGNL